MYAIVEIGGKQFKAAEGDRLYVPRQKADVGETLTFDRVLLVSGDDGVTVGAPTVGGASVSAEVLDHVKGDKVIVFKKKRRKGYRVKNGHRQPYTQIKIGDLSVMYLGWRSARPSLSPSPPETWHTKKASARPRTAATRTPTCSA